LLGWTKASAIDHALGSIELARRHRAPLVLCGPGDLVPLAHGLHRRAFGVDTLFVVCDPRRGNTAATVRMPATHADVVAALDAVAEDSSCRRRRRPPRALPPLVAWSRDNDTVQYVCLDEDSLAWLVRPGPIEVPALTERASEVPRIVDEYVFEAIVELAPTSRGLVLTERDRQWLLGEAFRISLAELEKATLCLVALRSTASLSQAAARLGIAAVSLHRWMARRQLPMPSGTARSARSPEVAIAG
jgi:hypothetical protein